MPIDFLWGDEDYLIERALNKIKKEVLGNDINALNYRAVDNPDYAEFCELLRTNAMMFGPTLIAIKCPKYFLNLKGEKKLSDGEVQELINAINNISQNIHIVLICPTPRGEKKKPDSRKKLYKELSKVTKPQEFQSYRSYEDYKVIPILKDIAKELELNLGQKEAEYLIQLTGTSLRDLAGCLEKLKLLAYPNNAVTFDMIKQIAPTNADIFNLVDLILEKKYDLALELISQILQKEHFLPSLAFIQTTFSNLVKIKLLSNKYSSYDIATMTNQNEYVVKMNMQKLAKCELDDLIRLKINLADSEYKLKSGAIKEPLLAYELAFLGGKL